MEEKKQGRRRFLLWGAGAGAITIFSGLGFFLRRPKKTETQKMLTQDGTLVEVNTQLLKREGKKASNADLQQWIKR